MAAWIGFGVVIMYLFLKAFGVLQSPLTADIFAIVGGAMCAGRYMQRVAYLESHIGKLENKVGYISLTLPEHLQDQKSP